MTTKPEPNPTDPRPAQAGAHTPEINKALDTVTAMSNLLAENSRLSASNAALLAALEAFIGWGYLAEGQARTAIANAKARSGA